MAVKVDEITFLKDGEPFDMWGLRVASGANTDQDTEGLLAALDDYIRHGINTITVFYQGSSGGHRQAFSPDGRSVDKNVQRRMDRIVHEANERGMVVVIGVFYQAATFLESRDAYLRAAELVAGSHRNHGNVSLNLVNENNDRTWKDCPFPVQDPDAIGELCAAAKAAAPDLLVGAGGYNTDCNLVIAKDSRVDVLWYDDHELWDTLPRYQAQGLNKPHVNVETFGTSSAGFVTLPDGSKVQGVFPEKGDLDSSGGRRGVRGKDEFRRAIALAAETPGIYVFGHLQAWFQGKIRGFPRNRYDLGGQGTLDDPGIRWYLEAVADARAGRREGR